jgi:hypothetical protein
MTHNPDRRAALLGFAAAAGTAALGSKPKVSEGSGGPIPQRTATLKALKEKLNAAPRRRDFKTVSMILENEDYWDHQALAELISYRGGPKQIWDNKTLAGPWLNLMRNNLNVQIYSFKHPDFLIISATHALAHLALYDQSMWDKYELSKLAGPGFATNTFILEQKAAAADPKNYQDPEGAFSPSNNSIPALQRRGAVFLGCHNSIWEQSETLIRNGSNPDKLSHEALAAELTNHLIPEVVLTPGAVATLLMFQEAGFHYAT